MNSIGIDIGGTKILIVSLDENGIFKKKVQFPTSDGNSRKVLEKIVAEINRFGNFSAVGVSIAGDIDSKNGILRYSPNLPKWTNVHLKKYFEKKLNVPTFVDNDANCAVYGSYVIDGKEKYKNFITVTLGTGIGGGVIIDGKLYRGSTGSAAEVGHITINLNGPRCNCGNYGCLEAYIGTKGIISIAKKMELEPKSKILHQARPEEMLKQVQHDTFGVQNNRTRGFQQYQNLTPAIIADRARKGDRRAIKVYEKFSEYLATGIGSLINIFNPDMITFSGGVSNNWDLIKKKFFIELKKRAFKTPLEHVKIIKSKNPENLGALGAALLSKTYSTTFATTKLRK